MIKAIAARHARCDKIAVAQVALINGKEAADAGLALMDATRWEPGINVIKRAAKYHEAAASAPAALAVATGMTLANVIHAQKAKVSAAQLPPYENEKGCCGRWGFRHLAHSPARQYARAK